MSQSTVVCVWGSVMLAASVASAQPLVIGRVVRFEAASPRPYAAGAAHRPAVWSERIHSPGAAFLRIHFAEFELSLGDSVTVSGQDGSDVWTYTDRGPHGDGEFWSFAVRGDTAFVRIHSSAGGGRGYRIDAIGHGDVDIDSGAEAPAPEVVCGTDGREDIACHTADPLIDAAQMPVARVSFISGGLLGYCTGWLVSGYYPNTMITNNHCVSTRRGVRSVQARFNHQRATCGGVTNAAATNYAGGALLRTSTVNGGLDYTLFTLGGSPEATWGELVPTTQFTAEGDQIWFIQHPGGGVKKVGYYEDAAHTVLCKTDGVNQNISGAAANSQMTYGCDSEGGSSGSPIIDASTGRAVALHHFGGVSSSPCLNSGTQMSNICAHAGALLNCQ